MREVYEERSIRAQGEAANTICNEFPTLRDQFAMAALISVGGTSWGMDVGNEKLAKECYLMADAMLKARKEKSNG